MHEKPYSNRTEQKKAEMRSQADFLKQQITLFDTLDAGAIEIAEDTEGIRVVEWIALRDPVAIASMEEVKVEISNREVLLPAACLRIMGENQCGETIFIDYSLVFDNYGNWLPAYSKMEFGSIGYNSEESGMFGGYSTGWGTILEGGLNKASETNREMHRNAQALLDSGIDPDRLEQLEDIVLCMNERLQQG